MSLLHEIFSAEMLVASRT